MHPEKPGAAFERLAAAVQRKLDPGAEVGWDEKISGRQIDVAVRGRLGSAAVLVIVECRDYATKLGVDHIDGLDSVQREVGANKAILVTSTGFTEDALKKAAKIGIDTCVLRASSDADYLGPAKPLKSMHLSVQLMSTVIENLEVELVDGRRFECSQFFRLQPEEGRPDFLDRFIKGWLQANGRTYREGEPLHLKLTPPARLLQDDEQPLVAKLHCVARTVPAFGIESIWQAPEEWVFVQLKPDGAVDERHFFEFPDLKATAETFKSI